jgi:hypothetical protein
MCSVSIAFGQTRLGPHNVLGALPLPLPTMISQWVKFVAVGLGFNMLR